MRHVGGNVDEPGSVKGRILAAAVTEFGAAGYHHTALRSIVERSGSNKPMVYYHYQGKEGLYLAAVHQLLLETAGALRETTAIEAPALVRLRRFAEVYLDAFLISRPMLGTVLRELSGLAASLYSTITDEHSRLIGAQLRRILADGVEQREFRKLDIESCGQAIAGILHHWVRFRHGQPELAMRTALTQLMEYYAIGMLSPQALQRHLQQTNAHTGD